LALSIVLTAVVPASGAQPPAAANPAVIATWNQHAIATLTIAPTAGGPGKVPPEVFLYLSFVHAAMYNAVNGITGEYELYRWEVRAPMGASPEAAAAVAAHRVLRTYFGDLGSIGADLDAKLAASLDAIPDGVAKDQGVRYGRRAADRIIALRANDGRNEGVDVPAASEPGDWELTPGVSGFLNPWYGYIEPLAVADVTAFDPGPPPQIGSDLYREEFEEVRDYGALVSAVRTPAMTQTALFFAQTPIAIQGAVRRFAMEQGLDISDSARLFVAFEFTLADALQAVWYAKHKYMWWRPITAIRRADTDGDPLTAGVPDWTSLLPAPPYPEWPSGLCSVIGAVSTVTSRFNGGALDLHIATPTAGERHYTDAATFHLDAVNARVWSGIHFRTADEESIDIGMEVGNYVLDHYFAPAN
jgi:hypothetical protein